jgi:UDP-N-acetylmuramate dehydrogenase
MHVHDNYPLLGFNTFGIDCTSRWFAEYGSAAELREIIQTDTFINSPSLLVGRGSNLLFLDNFKGLVIHSAMNEVRVVEHDNATVVIDADAGMLWDDLVDYAVGNGWWGIENLSLIPGEVGAAAVQNIGAYGVELCDVLVSVTVLHLKTGQEIVFPVAECGYGYRTSIFKTSVKNEFAILSVRLMLSRVPRPNFTYPQLEREVRMRGEPDLATLRKTIIEVRLSKLPDPAVLGNAGSFFMNPVISAGQWQGLKEIHPEMPSYQLADGKIKVPAAWLIEQCGWKGKSRGNAGVHDRQALVLVNRGGATGHEIADLAAEIQQSVALRFGIQLSPEVNYIS